MKNNDSVCVYRDTAHEETTKAEMQNAQRSLQDLLDTWNSMDIGPANDLEELLIKTDKVYDRAINKLVEVPDTGGKFKVNKSVYMDTLQLPDPSALYALAKRLRQQSYCGVPLLWTIQEGKVILVEEEAKLYIESRSIYATTPAAVQFARDMTKLCELLNDLNKRVDGELLPPFGWSYQWAQNKLKLTQRTDRGHLEASPDIDFLKRWLPKVK